jgi:hypothetical protein
VSPGWPNGGTHQPVMRLGPALSWGEPGELKHLSTRRRRNQQGFTPAGLKQAREITRVAASETVRRLNRSPREAGVGGATDESRWLGRSHAKSPGTGPETR